MLSQKREGVYLLYRGTERLKRDNILIEPCADFLYGLKRILNLGSNCSREFTAFLLI